MATPRKCGMKVEGKVCGKTVGCIIDLGNGNELKNCKKDCGDIFHKCKIRNNPTLNYIECLCEVCTIKYFPEIHILNNGG